MMNFEEWLLQKQKMNREWFLTMIPDKKPYYEEFDKYRSRKARFDAEVIRRECAKAAEEILALG